MGLLLLTFWRIIVSLCLGSREFKGTLFVGLVRYSESSVVIIIIKLLGVMSQTNLCELDINYTLFMVFEWFMTMHWWFITRNTINKCIYRYVHLLYYKKASCMFRPPIVAFFRGCSLKDIPYTQHISTQFNTYSFINIWYIHVDFKFLFNTSSSSFCRAGGSPA
jgi:hypothetical protein